MNEIVTLSSGFVLDLNSSKLELSRNIQLSELRSSAQREICIDSILLKIGVDNLLSGSYVLQSLDSNPIIENNPSCTFSPLGIGKVPTSGSILAPVTPRPGPPYSMYKHVFLVSRVSSPYSMYKHVFLNPTAVGRVLCLLECSIYVEWEAFALKQWQLVILRRVAFWKSLLQVIT